jgi:hypothetical protein
MNRADQLAAEYLIRKVRVEKLESQKPFTGPMPRCVVEPIADRPDRTSPLEAVAGFAVVALVFVLIFWGIA